MGDIIPTKIEELKSSDVQKVKGLAGIFTELRRFLYLFFSFLIPGIAFIVNWQYGNIYIGYILIVLGVLFGLFKIRDYLRRTI